MFPSSLRSHPGPFADRCFRLGAALAGVLAFLIGGLHAAEVPLLAGEGGITLDTPIEIGGGRFLISAPVIVNSDVYKPVKPEVEVVDDHNLRLKYADGATMHVVLGDSRATISFFGMPAEATAISMRMAIHREAFQGSRFVIDKQDEAVFPENDDRKELFFGKASALTLIDAAGSRLTVRSPDLNLRLENKGPEDWSHYACSWSFRLADHPGATSFTLDFALQAAGE